MSVTRVTAAKNILTDMLGGGLTLVRSWRFYAGLAVLFAGIRLNYMSQAYLYAYISHGKSLPVLSDMILDNIPLWDIDYMYDFASLLSTLVFVIYVAHRRKYRQVPLFLILCGAFHLVRGAFIVLTPFGNPPMFDGTGGLFNGFSNYELGVYPSGHTGISWMFFVLAADRRYRAALLACLMMIVAALFLSRAHYSIDVLSGIFFAYAIKAYGEKYWRAIIIPEASGRG
ncbi:MAG: phosphatase PAP2-related protein [Lentisphaeria bacterium]|nr:phosphatase PAP2-related protein [Lentisphaeria bacterium]